MSENKPHPRQAAALRKRPSPLLNTSTAMALGLASIALVPNALWDDVAAAVTEALAAKSMPVPHIFLVRPSDGARLDT